MPQEEIAESGVKRQVFCMKAIETTAVLDEQARIVPRQPLPERPTGEFRVILLLDAGGLDSRRAKHGERTR